MPEERVCDYVTAFLHDVESDPRVAVAVYFAHADGMHNTYGLSLKSEVRKPKIWNATFAT